jgi:vitamin-K-epoxide reductase (warfarin-sensitive)
MNSSRVLTFLIILLALAGVADSALVLREHYEFRPCGANETFNCAGVNHSPYAVVHLPFRLPGGAPDDPTANRLPVAIVGIVGYALIAALAGRARWLVALAALAGTLFALRLTYIEWRVLKMWCIYCVVSQGIIAAILVLAVVGAVRGRRTA